MFVSFSGNLLLHREVTYFMDHCFTVEEEYAVVNRPPSTSKAYVTTKPYTRSYYREGINSEITHWFCKMLRGSYFCNKQKCTECTKLKSHIEEKCHSSYIDLAALSLYQDHFASMGYDSKTPKVGCPKENQTMILAHYHPEPIQYAVKPYKEGWYLIIVTQKLWVLLIYN